MIPFSYWIFAGCLIVIVLFIRRGENKKYFYSRKRATNRTMDKKNKKNSLCITRHMKLNSPRLHWELSQNIVADSSLPKLDTFIPKMNSTLQLTGETERRGVDKEDCRSRKLATKRTKDKNSPRRNCELIKNLAADSSLPKLDTSIPEMNSTNHKRKVTRQTIDEKNKINSVCITPHTERNASGRNWELFKDIAANLSLPETNTSGKENVEKKSISKCRKSQKTHMLKLKVESTLQLTEETERNTDNKKNVTKLIAMDCEMVGIGDGSESMLARVSIVNSHNYCIYDKYVKPREPVRDYRTKVSGIRPHNLKNGVEFHIVQKEVAEILRGRILIGHALKYDLDVLYLSHPRRHLRDTSKFKIFKQVSDGRTPSLKKLANELLGREIQTGEHSSVEDARAAMQLYLLYKNKLESEFYSRR